jgi:dynactin-6
MQAETVIHPRARFESTLGSILIGRRCVIHERAHLGIEPKDTANASNGGVIVGDYVIVEVGAQIEAGGTEIGEGSVIQVGSTIGSGAKIGKVCVPYS